MAKTKNNRKNLIRTNIPVTAWVKIAKAGRSTKHCPVCKGRIIHGMYHVTLSDVHKESLSKEFYSSGATHIHIDCFFNLVEPVKKAVEKNKISIEQNKLKITTEAI